MSLQPLKIAKNISGYIVNMRVSSARSVKVNIIIGLKANSNGNVKDVNSEQHFEAEQ